jgi:hypothetical protein
LNRNGINRIGPELKILHQLEELEINENEVELISEDMFSLKNLRVLSLESNRLKKILRSIGKLPLAKLNLNRNAIQVCEFLNYFFTLVDISLDDNEISELIVQEDKWRNVETLSATKNRIKTVPHQLGQLPRLRYLNLSANLIHVIPVQLSALKALRFLGLSRNRLAVLGDQAIHSMESLEVLWVDQNRLERLPPSLAAKQTMREIWAHDNRISFVEDGYQHLPLLRVFTLARNAPSLDIPDALKLKHATFDEAWGMHPMEANSTSDALLMQEITAVLDKPLTEITERVQDMADEDVVSDADAGFRGNAKGDVDADSNSDGSSGSDTELRELQQTQKAHRQQQRLQQKQKDAEEELKMHQKENKMLRLAKLASEGLLKQVAQGKAKLARAKSDGLRGKTEEEELLELALQQLPGGKLKGRYFLAHQKRMLDVEALAATAFEDKSHKHTNPFTKLHGSELLRGVLRLTGHAENRVGVPEQAHPAAGSVPGLSTCALRRLLLPFESVVVADENKELPEELQEGRKRGLVQRRERIPNSRASCEFSPRLCCWLLRRPISR